eukprot:1159297-Pelagomonas_calceolata.AAC.2
MPSGCSSILNRWHEWVHMSTLDAVPRDRAHALLLRPLCHRWDGSQTGAWTAREGWRSAGPQSLLQLSLGAQCAPASLPLGY